MANDFFLEHTRYQKCYCFLCTSDVHELDQCIVIQESIGIEYEPVGVNPAVSTIFFFITVKLHLCSIFLCHLFKKSESKVITSRAFYTLFPQRNRVIIPQFMWGIGSRTPVSIKICRYCVHHFLIICEGHVSCTTAGF